MQDFRADEVLFWAWGGVIATRRTGIMRCITVAAAVISILCMWPNLRRVGRLVLTCIAKKGMNVPIIIVSIILSREQPLVKALIVRDMKS